MRTVHQFCESETKKQVKLLAARRRYRNIATSDNEEISGPLLKLCPKKDCYAYVRRLRKHFRKVHKDELYSPIFNDKNVTHIRPQSNDVYSTVVKSTVVTHIRSESNDVFRQSLIDKYKLWLMSCARAGKGMRESTARIYCNYVNTFLKILLKHRSFECLFDAEFVKQQLNLNSRYEPFSVATEKQWKSSSTLKNVLFALKSFYSFILQTDVYVPQKGSVENILKQIPTWMESLQSRNKKTLGIIAKLSVTSSFVRMMDIFEKSMYVLQCKRMLDKAKQGKLENISVADYIKVRNFLMLESLLLNICSIFQLQNMKANNIVNILNNHWVLSEYVQKYKYKFALRNYFDVFVQHFRILVNKRQSKFLFLSSRGYKLTIGGLEKALLPVWKSTGYSSPVLLSLIENKMSPPHRYLLKSNTQTTIRLARFKKIGYKSSLQSSRDHNRLESLLPNMNNFHTVSNSKTFESKPMKGVTNDRIFSCFVENDSGTIGEPPSVGHKSNEGVCKSNELKYSTENARNISDLTAIDSDSNDTINNEEVKSISTNNSCDNVDESARKTIETIPLATRIFDLQTIHVIRNMFPDMISGEVEIRHWDIRDRLAKYNNKQLEKHSVGQIDSRLRYEKKQYDRMLL